MNPHIPRVTVHAWSDMLAEQAERHTTALQRLIKEQRRLTRFIEENQKQMHPATTGVCIYMTGVIARMFELAGGRLKSATWEDVRAAEQRVGAKVGALLPLDDGFLGRLHAVTDRAQAHIVDEAAMVLFESEREEGEEELDKVEALKVLLVSWVVTEVLDANWSPGKDFVGEAAYAHVAIAPKGKKEEEAAPAKPKAKAKAKPKAKAEAPADGDEG